MKPGNRIENSKLRPEITKQSSKTIQLRLGRSGSSAAASISAGFMHCRTVSMSVHVTPSGSLCARLLRICDIPHFVAKDPPFFASECQTSSLSLSARCAMSSRLQCCRVSSTWAQSKRKQHETTAQCLVALFHCRPATSSHLMLPGRSSFDLSCTRHHFVAAPPGQGLEIQPLNPGTHVAPPAAAHVASR